MSRTRNLYATTALAIGSTAALLFSGTATADPTPPLPMPIEGLQAPGLPAIQSLSPAIQNAAANPTNATSMLMAAAAAFAGNSAAPTDSKNLASAVSAFRLRSGVGGAVARDGARYRHPVTGGRERPRAGACGRNRSSAGGRSGGRPRFAPAARRRSRARGRPCSTRHPGGRPSGADGRSGPSSRCRAGTRGRTCSSARTRCRTGAGTGA